MTVTLTQELMRRIFPKMSANQAQIFVNKQNVMAEILASSKRFALCCAHVQVETAGFNNAIVHNLTENTAYSAKNVVANWPHRYPSVAAVQSHFGTGPDWQRNLFDEIYGYEPDGKTPRMGNRPGTHDGSTYIGRGAPQITGRDGYATIGKMIGVDLVNQPELAASPDLQPDIIAAFWKWKKLSPVADLGNIVLSRKLWNGGKIGLDVVQKNYPRFLKIIEDYNPTSAARADVIIAPTAKVDENLRTIQQDLISLGYYEIGKSDGQFGGKTQGAIKAFFTDRGMIDVISNYPDCAGVLNNSINAALLEGWHRPIAPGRAYATADDIAPKVSSIAPTKSAGFFAKIGAWFTGVTATGKAAFLLAPDLNSESYSYISFIKEIWNEIPDWVFPAAIFIIAIIIVRQTTKAKTETVSAYQQGKIN